MYYLFRIFRLLLLLFSFYGMVQFLKERKVKSEFLLPIIFSAIGVLMFFAGILNVLVISAYSIFFIGVFLAVKSLITKSPIKSLITCGTVTMAITLIFLFVFTYGNKFTHYDNFSHWGIVLKQIILTDSFPNFDDVNIMFQSYPTGSAGLIYYFTKITGIRSEWFCIFTQQIITVSMLCSVFVFFDSRKKINYVLGFPLVLLILFVNAEYSITHDLLVDTLLPLIAVAAISICIYYREDIKSCTLYVLPIICFLMAVKNSGILFVMLIIAYYIYRYAKLYGIKRIFQKNELMFLISPFITLLLWNRHTKYVFEQGLTAKHSLSAEYYNEVLGNKTPEIISRISKTFLGRVINYENTFWLVVLVLLICFVLFKFLKIKSAVVSETILISVIFYVCWQLGTYSMYLLSMPNEEALNLDGYYRYHQTALIFICGLMLIVLAKVQETIPSVTKYKKVILTSFCFLVGISFAMILRTDITLLNGSVYNSNERNSIDEIVETYGLDTTGNTDYFVIWDGSGYHHFMTKYVLYPKNLYNCDIQNFEKDKEMIGNYDYLIVVTSNETVDDFLVRNYGNSNLKAYRIT